MALQRDRSVWVKVVLGALGGVLSLALASTAFFRWGWGPGGLSLEPRFSFLSFFRRIPEHARWLAPFMVLSAAMVPLRALQWQRTLSKAVPYRERYHLVAIGAFTHNALPGKLGDVMRAFLMARTQQIPFLRSLGSVVVCKLLEFCALMLLVFATLLGPFREMAGELSGVLRIAAPVALGLVVGVVLLAHHAQGISAWLDGRGRLPHARTFLREVGEGLGTARSFRGMAVALAYSALPVLSSVVAYGIALESIGVTDGRYAGPIVIAAISLGQSAVGLPAGMGVYYFLSSWTARKLGAGSDEAAAFAALSHAATVAAQVSVGAASLWVRKIKWHELRRRTQLAAEAAREVEGLEPARA